MPAPHEFTQYPAVNQPSRRSQSPVVSLFSWWEQAYELLSSTVREGQDPCTVVGTYEETRQSKSGSETCAVQNLSQAVVLFPPLTSRNMAP